MENYVVSIYGALSLESIEETGIEFCHDHEDSRSPIDSPTKESEDACIVHITRGLKKLGSSK